MKRWRKAGFQPSSTPRHRPSVAAWAGCSTTRAGRQRQAVIANPTASETHRILGLTLLRQGRIAEAEATFRETLRLAPDDSYTFAALGWAAVADGRPDEARARLTALAEKRRNGYVSPVAFVLLYAALGEADATFEWLERAYQDRRGWLAYLRVEPALAPFRGDQRLTAFIERMHL